MTNEVYDALSYQFQTSSSNSISQVSESISMNNVIPQTFLFMLGGNVSLALKINRSDNYRILGNVKIKDENSNIVAEDDFSYSGGSYSPSISFNVNPFNKYTVEVNITENSSYVSSVSLTISGYVHRKNKFITKV